MEHLVTMSDMSSMSGVFDSDQYLDKMTTALKNIHIQQRLLGDPDADMVHQNMSGHYLTTSQRSDYLLSKENVKSFLSNSPDSGLPQSVSDYLQSGTSVSVMDDKDVYVSMILSLNGQFGSGEFSSGFLLNNAMAAFDQTSLRPEANGGDMSSNTLWENQRPLYRGAPMISVNTAETCKSRVATGRVLLGVFWNGKVGCKPYWDTTTILCIFVLHD